MSLEHTRSLLARHGFQPKKSWGQNFLVDDNAVARIADAARLVADDVVVEIGAGLGALTTELGARAGRVVALERDPDMLHVLRAELGEQTNIEIHAGDAGLFDYAARRAPESKPLIVVGNLPYQITSKLLFTLFAGAARGHVIARAVVMMQKEVADRLRAPHGSRTYGRLSVMAQQEAEISKLFDVGAGAFWPRPRVTSTVLRLVPRAQALAPVRDGALFAEVVRRAFGMRRKMLRRALADVWGDDVLARAFADADVAGTRRAEELDVPAFGRLTNALDGKPRCVPPDADDQESNDDDERAHDVNPTNNNYERATEGQEGGDEDERVPDVDRRSNNRERTHNNHGRDDDA